MAKKIKSINNNFLWGEVQAFIISKFDTQTSDEYNTTFTISGDQLLIDLQKEFKSKFDPEFIFKLLKNGFEVSPNVYSFNNRDFLKVSTPIKYNG